MNQNPLERDQPFSLTLRNPNPRSSKTKEGPVYRVSFELTPEEWQMFMDTNTQGMVVECVATVTHRNGAEKNFVHHSGEPDLEDQDPQWASELWRVGFFFNPKVHAALGSDADFRDWVERQPSVLTERFNEHVNGVGRCIAHHVLSAEAAPARDGEHPNKPAYRCVPLTDEEHRFFHQHGALAALREFVDIGMFEGQEPDAARKSALEWWKKMAADYVSRWAHRRLADALGVESLTQAEPQAIFLWAVDNGVHRNLPRRFDEFREHDEREVGKDGELQSGTAAAHR
jgi:hypothetical protein